MAKPVTLPTTFASEFGNQPASQLDNNFSPLALAINDYSTYSTYLTDTGAVNAMVATVAGPLTFSYSNNVSVDLLVSITNTSTTPTLNVNAIGAITVKDASGAAVAIGALLGGTVYRLNHDGVNFRVQGTVGGVQSFKQLTVGAPAAGVALTINGLSTGVDTALFKASANSAQGQISFAVPAGTIGSLLWDNGTSLTGTANSVALGGAASTTALQTSSANRVLVNGAGNVTINPPSSGTPLSILSGTTGLGLDISSAAGQTSNIRIASNANALGTTSFDLIQDGGSTVFLYNRANAALNIGTNNSSRIAIAAAGNVTINAPGSGVALIVAAVAGTHSTKIADSANNSFNAGFLESPGNTQNANYTTVLSDSGKTIYHSDGVARTYTIDSNANVAYPVGTILAFENDASGAVNVTISITTDVLVLSPLGSTGSRTLAQFGRAVARKVTATRWIIAGSGLS